MISVRDPMVVTGASGFLGSNYLIGVAAGLPKGEPREMVACPVSFRHRGVPERLRDLQWHPWIRVVLADLAAPIADTTAGLLGTPARIINFASESSIPRSMADPAGFTENNIKVMLNVLEYARALPCPPLLVHISTDEVYGPAFNENGHREWAQMHPVSPYSASKAAQEMMVIAWSQTYEIPAIIINTMNPLGPTQDPEKYLPALIRKTQLGETIQVHVDGHGRAGSRAYLDVRDLNAAIELVARRAPKPGQVHRYNVSGAVEVDNLELAGLVADVMGRPLKYEKVHSDVPSHGMRHALDTTIIREHGWAQQYTLRETVERVVEHTLNSRVWNSRVPS